jgi:hypothetical protein
MFISTEVPYNRYVHAFQHGKEIQLCVWFDTKDQEAYSLRGIGNVAGFGVVHKNNITFKLERGKNIPEPFFTELTTDKCFAGFID